MTSQAAADASKGDQAGTRAAGRGGLAIAVAKVSFILVGFIQQLLFPRILDEAGYGAVVRMLTVVSVVNNIVVAMSLQGVSRMVVQARDEEKEQTVRTTLLVHSVIAIVVSTAFALLAGFIARRLEAPLAERPLRIAAGVVLCYGVYAPLVGALNGRKRFLDQAGLDIFYGISRTIAMTGTAWFFASVLGGDGTVGAAIGFVSAAALIVPIAMWRSGIGKAGPGGTTSGEYLRFLVPVLFAQAGLNLFLQLDILMLSQAAGEYARVVGLDPKEADKLLGPYRAPQLFGFLPYQLLMSVQFVLFPLLAKASADADAEGVKRLTRAGMRLAFVLTGLIAGTIGSLAPQLVRFAFPENIALQSAPFARIYTLGLSGLAILGVASAALASLRRERWSMLLTWIAAGLVAVSIISFRGEGTFGPDLLRSTAEATALAMIVAAALGSLALYRAAGAFVSPFTLLRVLGAVGIVVAIGTRLPWMGKLMAPVLAIAMAIVYVVLLIASGEVGRADLASIRAVVSRRKG